jgi:hypothetical protein
VRRRWALFSWLGSIVVFAGIHLFIALAIWEVLETERRCPLLLEDVGVNNISIVIKRNLVVARLSYQWFDGVINYRDSGRFLIWIKSNMRVVGNKRCYRGGTCVDGIIEIFRYTSTNRFLNPAIFYIQIISRSLPSVLNWNGGNVIVHVFLGETKRSRTSGITRYALYEHGTVDPDISAQLAFLGLSSRYDEIVGVDRSLVHLAQLTLEYPSRINSGTRCQESEYRCKYQNVYVGVFALGALALGGLAIFAIGIYRVSHKAMTKSLFE